MNQLVSVIIPTRNRCLFLPNALESILNQRYDEIEVIVVDDASEDSTPSVIDKYADRFRTLKYFRNKERYGAAKSRNIGIRSAAGEYIAFLDDDDEWLPGKIEAQLQFLKAHPDLMAVSSWWIKNINGRKIKVRKNERISLEDMLWDNFLGSFSFVMVRADVFNKAGFIDEHLSSCHDWEFWIRVSRIYKVGVVNKFLTLYHWHSGNISNWTPATLSSYRKVYERNKHLMSEQCKKYHIQKLVINDARIIDGTGERLRTFFNLLKINHMDLRNDLHFIVYGFLVLACRDSILMKMGRYLKESLRASQETELSKVYAGIHKSGFNHD